MRYRVGIDSDINTLLSRSIAYCVDLLCHPLPTSRICDSLFTGLAGLPKMELLRVEDELYEYIERKQDLG